MVLLIELRVRSRRYTQAANRGSSERDTLSGRTAEAGRAQDATKRRTAIVESEVRSRECEVSREDVMSEEKKICWLVSRQSQPTATSSSDNGVREVGFVRRRRGNLEGCPEMSQPHHQLLPSA